jgi:hypothetical protein
MNARNAGNAGRPFSFRSLRHVIAAAGAIAIASLAACSSATDGSPAGGDTTPACKAGTTVACTCANGSTGSQTCGAASCTCNAPSGGDHDAATTPPTGGDAGAGTGDGDGGHLHDAAPTPSDAAPGTYGATCAADKDCTDAVFNACFVGGNRSFCTKKCTTNADCPAPPTVGQCNKQGYCK